MNSLHSVWRGFAPLVLLCAGLLAPASLWGWDDVFWADQPLHHHKKARCATAGATSCPAPQNGGLLTHLPVATDARRCSTAPPATGASCAPGGAYAPAAAGYASATDCGAAASCGAAGGCDLGAGGCDLGVGGGSGGYGHATACDTGYAAGCSVGCEAPLGWGPPRGGVAGCEAPLGWGPPQGGAAGCEAPLGWGPPRGGVAGCGIGSPRLLAHGRNQQESPVLTGLHHFLQPHCNSWGRIEYLLWWYQSQRVPPLVTTSPNGTPRDQAGVLPGAQILVGNESLDYDARSGGRVSLGLWIDDCATWGIGGRFVGLEGGVYQFAANQDDFPILARPFFNARTNQSDAALVTYPDVVAGQVNVGATTNFYAGDAFVRKAIRCCGNWRVDVVAGYQFARFDEDLVIRDQTTSIDPGSFIPVGTQFDVVDSFDVKNEFHGGELGLMTEIVQGRWTLELLTKVALGNMRETVRIRGTTDITLPGFPAVTMPGGLLAQPTNIGEFTQNEFAAVPEAGLTIGYQLTESASFTFGYSLIYLSNVVRPGDQIDTAVNLTQSSGGMLVGPARPAFGFVESDQWVQGANFGLNWRF